VDGSAAPLRRRSKTGNFIQKRTRALPRKKLSLPEIM
jgi:hypothetical protein